MKCDVLYLKKRRIGKKQQIKHKFANYCLLFHNILAPFQKLKKLKKNYANIIGTIILHKSLTILRWKKNSSKPYNFEDSTIFIFTSF